jgi:glycerophosphoryl diester phosphodiesterase
MHRRFISAAIVGLLFFACKKDVAVLEIRNLENKIYAFGHGGMGIKSLYPIDSYQSLTKSLKTGADGTEMDLQLSADSVLFLYHAPNLNESSDCSGTIRKSKAGDITCKYKSLVHKGISIARLEEFLEAVKTDTSSIFTFECKSYDLEQKDFALYVRTLKRVITTYQLENRVLIESVIPQFLQRLKTDLPGCKTFLYAEDVDWAIATADSLDFYGVTFDFNRVNKAEVRTAHEHNLRVTLFNQQSRADNKKTLEMCPDFIQTDALTDLVDLLR